ncbi:hypothetical protein FSP39_005307 [Pinctada imbricata]|uniref:Coiled-coil domain-containing protein 186 n=1 Tax=Pinctada imbricata TaxID=66713 RepID=A0AA89BU41_PINIB|nr:hypothetical protein FSP39_005307 [Pinctada imbricata]
MENPEPESDNAVLQDGEEEGTEGDNINHHEIDSNEQAEEDIIGDLHPVQQEEAYEDEAIRRSNEDSSETEESHSVACKSSDGNDELAEQDAVSLDTPMDDKTEDEIEQECIREGQVTESCDEQIDTKQEILEETEVDASFAVSSPSHSVPVKQDKETVDNVEVELEEPENEHQCGRDTDTINVQNNAEASCSEGALQGREVSYTEVLKGGEKESTDKVTASATEEELLEDEIGCVAESKSLKKVTASSKLAHTESVESYEPECDQEEASVETAENGSPAATSQSPSHPSVEEPPGIHVKGEIQHTSDSGTSGNDESTECASEKNFVEESEIMIIAPVDNSKSDSCVHSVSSVVNTCTTSPSEPTIQTSCVVTSSNEDQTSNESSPHRVNCASGNNLSDDDLLLELESELGPSETQNTMKIQENVLKNTESVVKTQTHTQEGDTSSRVKSTKSCEREVEVGGVSEIKALNGVTDIDSVLWRKLHDLQSQVQQQEEQIQRLQHDKEEDKLLLEKTIKERDFYIQENQKLKSHNVDDLYLPQIKELEYTISQQQNEIRLTKEKLQSHDTAAKRAVAALQNELKVRVDQVTKMYEEANREKDTMVVKYAQAEKNYLEMQKSMERTEARLRDNTKEKEGLMNKLKEMKAEKKKVAADIDEKSSEIQKLNKEIEKQRDVISSSDVRVKWAQNKLRAELEAHKETKAEHEKTKLKLKDAKEETEQIRKDCQAIVKTYQESEEIKSNALDSQLKVKESELLQQQQEKTDTEELHQATVRELEQLKIKHREALTELETLRDKSQCLEMERIQTEQTLNKFKEMLQKQKKENRDLQTKVEELVQVKTDFKRAQSTIKSLDAEISELKITNKDLMIEMEACKKRESEKLELTEKLSAKNAELLSENSNLRHQCMSLNGELQTLKMEHQSLETQTKNVSDKLEDELYHNKAEVQRLSQKLEEKSKAVEQLTVKLEDGKDEVKTLKRKHVNNIKDLTRQLQQVRRKLEVYEVNGESQKDSTSMGSRTSSSGSLNTIGMSEGGVNVPPNNHHNNNSHVRQSSPPEQIQEYPVITEQVEPDRQVLIERIVKLQRSLARKNEKIEFVEDHIQQLVDEIQKKNKIIQTYAMREEAGMLTPEEADFNKLQLSRKHSIMGSVYSSHQTDSAMTLDLSLEINRKLQAVLEDTLLKNITLKESLDTLGGEISRLSQENREMQLQLREKKPRR